MGRKPAHPPAKRKVKRMIMNKAFMRCLICFVMLGYGFLFIVVIGNFASEAERLQEEHLYVRALLGLVGALGSVSTFLVWALMLYHWGTNLFKTSMYKWFWFLVMSLGMVVGSWFYYIMVFELGKTLTKDAEEELKVS